jgi:TPR repeat protein
MISSHTIASVLSFICLTVPVWADDKAVKEAYDLAVERGDYATAMRELRPLAEQGLAAAQFNLGLLYANGQGVQKDDAQARQWYEKAAAQGHADAQVNLGILFVYGRGVPQDYKIAVYCLRMSANQGNDLAQRKLGLLYERGDGVPQDYLCPGLYVVHPGGSERSKATGRAAGCARQTDDP